jgi:hypothetical protein
LTFSYKTSGSAHKNLEKLVLIKCEQVKNIDYGLKKKRGTMLKIALTPDTLWLLQPELRAIKKGLKFRDELA